MLEKKGNNMTLEYAIKGENIGKKFKGFTLDIPELKAPKGVTTVDDMRY